MKAITLPQFSGSEVPTLVDVDVDEPQPAAGDVMQRMGTDLSSKGESGLPRIEVSGHIAAAGADVEGWAVGDEVCALLAGGGYVEKAAAPVVQVMSVPRCIGLATSAALPEVSSTVWNTLFIVAIPRGARVAVTAGFSEKLDICHELGVEILIDYKKQNFVEALHDATDGRGAEVILDNMGADYLPRNVDALAFRGGGSSSSGCGTVSRAPCPSKSS